MSKPKLRGPNYIAELLHYKCPFTDRTLRLHPTKWLIHIEQEAKKYSFEEISLVYNETQDEIVRKVLQCVLLYYHNSTVQ